jgi:hypothetical protein
MYAVGAAHMEPTIIYRDHRALTFMTPASRALLRSHPPARAVTLAIYPEAGRDVMLRGRLTARTLNAIRHDLRRGDITPPDVHMVPNARGEDAEATSTRKSASPLDGDNAPTGRVAAAFPDGHYTIVHTDWNEGGGGRGGIRAHRGILHPDEYVDAEALLVLAERALGFTADQVRSVYRRGPLGAAGRALRDRIDDRVAEIYETGGSMAALGRALGLATRNGNCDALENAIRRTLKDRVSAALSEGVRGA